MAVDTKSRASSVFAEENSEKREQLIEMLKKAYWMEIETVMSYIANTINPDGVRAREVVENLEQDIQEELGHAQQFGNADQGAVRRRARQPGVHGGADLPPAAGGTRPTSCT